MDFNFLHSEPMDLSAAGVENIKLPALNNGNITLNVLRLDKIHPVISGNKWFKLKYYVQDAINNNYSHLLTFGGAYSNHIVACAYAATSAGLKSTGIIRGEKPKNFSATLKDALEHGMQLEFITREEYQNKHNPEFLQYLSQKYPGSYIIAEGGEGKLGFMGASEILNLVDKSQYSHLLCAVGTGTMLKGIASVSTNTQQVIGIPVLKGFEKWMDQQSDIEDRVKQRTRVFTEYHFGGYAKNNTRLLAFMNEWYQSTHIPLDFVYTGKLLFAVDDLLKKNYFPRQSSLLVIHSGGLQGNRSLREQDLIF